MTKKRKQDEAMFGIPRERGEGDLREIGGSLSDDWNNILINQTVGALWTSHSSEETLNRQVKAAIAGLRGIAPRDELEGMMAAQLVAAHSAAMECYRRAMIPEQTLEGRTQNLNYANKLTRASASLLDALNKHRGKGQQKVTVEHVHVHAGGQAVVGTVERPGGGAAAKDEEQPDAKQIAHAPEPPLWSEDESRHAVPVASDDER